MTVVVVDGRNDVGGEDGPRFGCGGTVFDLDGFVPGIVVAGVARVDCEGWRGEPSESYYDHSHDEKFDNLCFSYFKTLI